MCHPHKRWLCKTSITGPGTLGGRWNREETRYLELIFLKKVKAREWGALQGAAVLGRLYLLG
jgi:hypothetical protein